MTTLSCEWDDKVQTFHPGPGDSIQVVNVVKDLGVLMDNSFSPSIHCKGTVSKARWMLFMIKRSFNRGCPSLWQVSSAPLWVRHAGLLAKPFYRRRLSGANPSACEKARKEFPRTAIWGTTTSAGSTLPTQAPPPWRPHSRIQNVFWRIGYGPQPLFYSASAACLEGSPFQSSQKDVFLTSAPHFFRYRPFCQLI